MSTFENLVLVLGSFVAASTTAFVLEFLFPKAITETTPDGIWFQLIGSLIQWWLFFSIAPNIAAYLSIEVSTSTLNVFTYSTLFIGAFVLQPNCMAKFTSWSTTIQSQLHNWLSARWTGGVGGYDPNEEVPAPDVSPPPPAAPGMIPLQPTISHVKIK